MGQPPLRRGGYGDVEDELARLGAAGVAVHAVEGFEAAGIRSFPRMSRRELLTGRVAEFMTQFDALVLLYDAPPGLQWFAGNMPVRFLSGLDTPVGEGQTLSIVPAVAGG